uniref:BPTI/Kunitz inhibitor domain-containing protein n=1 Tax=Amblyomma triste TaxID=251400 RepID=A0A023GE77_AMBTT
MEMHLALAFFVFIKLCAATSISTKDPKCISDKPFTNPNVCTVHSWQFNPLSKRCVRTCNTGGPFSTKLECDGRCRSVDVCTAPRAVSSCAGPVHPIYFYNPSTGRCEEDIGCIYSGNNFPSLKECRETCIKRRPAPPKPERCFAFPSHGYRCWWGFESWRFYYNPFSGQCIPFRFYGCGGGPNNFPSYEGCIWHCGRQRWKPNMYGMPGEYRDDIP